MADILIILIGIGLVIGEELKANAPAPTQGTKSELFKEKERLSELHFGKNIYK